MDNTCCICLDIVNIQYHPWNCRHNYHIVCANRWNGTCPLCRCPKKKKKAAIDNYTYMLGMTHGHQVTIKKYQWDKLKCNHTHKSHKIIYHKPYGVVGICSCGCIQAFNWLH